MFTKQQKHLLRLMNSIELLLTFDLSHTTKCELCEVLEEVEYRYQLETLTWE